MRTATGDGTASQGNCGETVTGTQRRKIVFWEVDAKWN